MAFFGYLLLGLSILYILKTLKRHKKTHIAGTFKITTSLETGTYIISVKNRRGKPIGLLIHYLAKNLYDYSINDDGRHFAHGHVDFVSKNEVNYVNRDGNKTAKLKLNVGQFLLFNKTRMKEYRIAS